MLLNFKRAAVALLIGALGFSLASAPAQAAPVQSVGASVGVSAATAAMSAQAQAQARMRTEASCPSGHVCGWNWSAWTDAGGMWHTHVQNLFGTCVTLPTSGVAGFPNGNPYDTFTSIYFNSATQGGTDDQIRFYNWAQCTPAGGYFTLAATEVAMAQPDLTCPTFMYPCNPVYHNWIGSMRFCNHGC